MRLLYKQLRWDAVAPCRAHDTDAGYDVCSCESAILAPGQRHTFMTGLAVQLDSTAPPYYLRVAGRSGLASKRGIDVLGGVIDQGYTGEVGVVLLNTGSHDFVVTSGDKIAQLVPTLIPLIEACELVADFDFTSRGGKGFGSTKS